MKNKWNVVAWGFLAVGIMSLINATSKAGFYPSGHPAGRIPEVIQGATFVICSVAYLIYERRKAEAARRQSQ